ncbi:MAG: sigma-70 family RNA polymerase sigma factor [Myxococcota bacterium]
MSSDELFEEHRPAMLALAYRMLGDMGSAEDIVQNAWLQWQGRGSEVDQPKAYLIKTVTRLCLNDLGSARARREEARGDRLPEPLDLEDVGIAKVEALDRISMAFIVLLQRLTPAERAVLLLHEIFDFEHEEIAGLLQKSDQACRQLLKRAREHVATERRTMSVPAETHRRLLRAFLQAASSGDLEQVTRLLADDVVLIADAGPEGGVYGRVRNLPGPIVGRAKVAAFVATVTPQGAAGLVTRECELNGQPAVLMLRDGRPYTAILLSIADDTIRAVFIHADPARLRHVGRIAS